MYYKNEFLKVRIFTINGRISEWMKREKMERAGMKKDNREGKGLDDFNKKKKIRSLLCHIIRDNSRIGFGL